jgi:hypothetical protein
MEYPITISISYTEKLSRLTTFFRAIMVIPHLIVLWALGIASSYRFHCLVGNPIYRQVSQMGFRFRCRLCSLVY